MKDLDSIKLKSEENDELKNKNNIKPIRKDLFHNNKVFNNLIKYGKDNSVNICLLTIAILINIYGLYSYLYSLKGCKNSRAYCLHYYSMEKINEIITNVLRTGISYSLIFILSFKLQVSSKKFSVPISTLVIIDLKEFIF